MPYEEYAAYHPQLHPCLPRLRDIVRRMQMQGLRASQKYELEIRLGTAGRDGAPFAPGVSREHFETVLERMQEAGRAGTWVAHRPWHTVVDIIGASGLRTRMELGAQTTFTHTVKKKVQVADFVSSSPSMVDMRAGLSVEEEYARPDTVLDAPKLVRVRSRTVFLYGGSERAPLWRFDLSRVWQGDTMQQAMDRMHSNYPPRYEMEVELENPTHAFEQAEAKLRKTPDGDVHAYIATSILLKTLTIVPYRDVWWQPNT